MRNLNTGKNCFFPNYPAYQYENKRKDKLGFGKWEAPCDNKRIFIPTETFDKWIMEDELKAGTEIEGFAFINDETWIVKISPSGIYTLVEETEVNEDSLTDAYHLFYEEIDDSVAIKPSHHGELNLSNLLAISYKRNDFIRINPKSYKLAKNQVQA